MASKISSDISSNVDITSRKGDSFYLEATITNADGGAFDVGGYSVMEFIVTNSNGSTYLKLNRGGSSANNHSPNYYQMIAHNDDGGVVTIQATDDMMNFPIGTYVYYLRISSANYTHTMLHGKFKLIS